MGLAGVALDDRRQDCAEHHELVYVAAEGVVRSLFLVYHLQVSSTLAWSREDETSSVQ